MDCGRLAAKQCLPHCSSWYVGCQTGVLVHEDYCQQPVLQLIRGRLHSAAQLLRLLLSHNTHRDERDSLSWVHNQTIDNDIWTNISKLPLIQPYYLSNTHAKFCYPSKPSLRMLLCIALCFIFIISSVLDTLCPQQEREYSLKYTAYRSIKITCCCGIFMKRKLESATNSSCDENPVLYDTL